MSKWLNGRIKGRPNIERTLCATEDESHEKLAQAVKKHRERGDREKDVFRGSKYVCEVYDRNGELAAVYWLSDEDGTPEPQA